MCLLGFNIGSASGAGSQTQTTATTASTATASTTAAAAAAAAASSSGLAAVTSKSAVASSSSRREVNQDVCSVPGFTALQWLLSQHPHVPQVYFMMMALLVGQPVQQLPQLVQVTYTHTWLPQLVQVTYTHTPLA